MYIGGGYGHFNKECPLLCVARGGKLAFQIKGFGEFFKVCFGNFLIGGTNSLCVFSYGESCLPFSVRVIPYAERGNGTYCRRGVGLLPELYTDFFGCTEQCGRCFIDFCADYPFLLLTNVKSYAIIPFVIRKQSFGVADVYVTMGEVYPRSFIFLLFKILIKEV